MGSSAFPDTASQVAPGAIHGSVFGGHSPIIGARVYVYEAGQNGYASASVSKLNTGTAQDANGNYYVATDIYGGFNITGDYTCDVGHPVYLAAVGGSPSSNLSIPITSASTTYTGNHGLGYTYSIVFTAANELFVGQGVSFASNALTGSYGTYLNGTTQTVTAATTSSFTISFGPIATSGAISGTTSGSATSVAVYNPAAINIAVLGLCPGTSGEFANTLSFVYTNEVSTAAAAYALGAFGSGPFNIGASSTNLNGIQNAAINAGQLYDIQGSDVSTSLTGEGHIARAHTPAGNGIVAQSTLDTIGNILASCIDSPNTTTSLNTESSQCNTLFSYATSNGVPSGTKRGTEVIATDTTTAAFNIAHYPAGAASYSANFMSNIYSLQSAGSPPFSPMLTNQPNDFTVGIQYPLALNAYLGQADSLGIDSTGGVWGTARANHILFHLSPVGVLTTSTTQSYTLGSVSVDPSNNAWAGNLNASTGITELSSAGVLLSGPTASGGNGGTGYAGPYTNAASIVTNSLGDALIGSILPATSQSNLTELNGSGNQIGASVLLATSLPAPDDTAHANLDSAGSLWISSENGNVVDRIDPTTGIAAAGFPVATGTSTQPEAPGIDHANNAWVALQTSNTVDKVTATGAVTHPTGATLSGPFGAVVDGVGNIWVTNRTSNSLVEYNGANSAAISPTSNYTAAGLLSDPRSAAIDPSGDLWIANFNGGSIVEILGPVAPVVTPLSTAAGANQLATRP